jgi:hypothetical protein
LVLGRIDPDAACRLCVQISQFSAKLDDGTCVAVPRKYVEWTVDCRYYNLEMIEKELAERVKWGCCQQLKICEFDMSSGGEVSHITKNHKVIREVVNLKNKTCTCREWQVSGKPCPHALGTG